MLKMAYQIRMKQYLISKWTNSSDEDIPQIYVKLKGWNPPPASLSLEDKLTHFEKQVTEAVTINN